jgi:hypothetical protein
MTDLQQQISKIQWQKRVISARQAIQSFLNLIVSFGWEAASHLTH